MPELLRPEHQRSAPPPSSEGLALTVNAGSSSVKMALFAAGPRGRIASGAVSRIGTSGASLTLSRADRAAGEHDARPLAGVDHAGAAAALLEALVPGAERSAIIVVSHRVVHGGARYMEAQRVSPGLLAELRRLAPLDPDHLPPAIALLEAMSARMPAVPQVACFDTAFHRSMPRAARALPIPLRYRDQGVERYGFHGLSCTSLVEQLARVAGPESAHARLVLAHLGAGASLTAVVAGRSVDTTMGFTPNSGVPMATRSGDLEPGVLLHLMRAEGLGPDGLDDLLNRHSGLLGVSGTSGDMRDLLAAEASDPRASEAVELFCYQAKKAIGALAAAMGGVDTLVFSGGIGENAAPVRARITSGLEHLGIRLDDARNGAGEALISSESSACAVRVLRTDEEAILAREALRIVCGGGLSQGETR